MTVFRTIHDKENPYTIVNKTICTDRRLSWKAKGIWLYAFSRPDDWEFNQSDLLNQSTDGPTSLANGLQELEECGYLHRERERNQKGHLKKSVWNFFETPKSEDEIKKIFPKAENPILVNPRLDNEPLLSKESNQLKKGTTTGEGKVVVSFSNLRVSDSLKKKIVKQYTPKEIETAVKRCERWTSRKSDEAALMTALKNAGNWNDTQSEEEIIEANRNALKTLEPLDLLEINGTKILVGPSSVEFVSGMKNDYYKITSKDFITKVKEKLDRLKINLNKIATQSPDFSHGVKAVQI